MSNYLCSMCSQDLDEITDLEHVQTCRQVEIKQLVENLE